LKKFGFDMIPVIWGSILGPVIENGFRRTMVMSDGNLAVFFERPGRVTMIVVIAGLVGAVYFLLSRRRKADAVREPPNA